MLKQICSEYERQLVSEIEALLPPPSFTINTIKMLKKEFGSEGQWHILMGADNWLTFREWHQPENLLQEVNIIVYPRPGYAVPSLPEGVSLMRESVSPYSSTTIRKHLAQGKPVENIGVPPSIQAYIQRHHLYGYGEKTLQQNDEGYSWDGEEATGH
jgi:nicotinate-nucleotide adenylyltransferase